MKKGVHLEYHIKQRLVLGFAAVLILLLYAFKNVSFLSRAAATIGLVAAFYLMDHWLDLKFKGRHYLFIALIALGSFLFSPLYFIYPLYDKILHLLQPMLLCSLVFHLTLRLPIKLRWKLVFTFFIALGAVGLFEIGEYALDYFFDLKLQGVFLRNLQSLEKLDILVDRLDDTMIDMILGLAGAALYVAGIIVFFRNRVRRQGLF